MTTYSVKEIFYTLQGEGAQSGRPAVFCRFAGCNLWSGREQDRRKAVCQFCDTDFVGTDGDGGGKFSSAEDLAKAIAAKWPDMSMGRPYVVCTGGEPLMQLDESLVEKLHEYGFEVAVETNGTLPPPSDLDWICVSPKAGADFVLKKGNELKLVFPQPELMPDRISDVEFEHFYLQPMDGPDVARHTALAIQYCMDRPNWKLSLQTHKTVGIR